MVLSSQMARPGTTRSNMYARGRARRNRLIAILGGGAVLLISAWWFWPESSSGAQGRTPGAGDDVAQNAGLNASTEAHQTLNNSKLATNTPVKREPPRLEPKTPEIQPLLPSGINPGDEPLESPADDVNGTEHASDGAPPLTMGQTPGTSKFNAAPEKHETPVTEQKTPEPNPSRPFAANDVNAEVAGLLDRADREINSSRFVEGRVTLNQALSHPRVGAAAEQIRTRLAELNAMMVFGKTVVKDDRFADTHVIKSGDRMALIARAHAVDVPILAQINGMANPDQIRTGQSLKVINGPFHVEIDKSDYRLDVYLGEPGSADRTYVRSFFIGLGELGSTPTGQFRVRSNGKVENPGWTNPRTGEHFNPKDPKNPIGKFWIGLQGTDEQSKLLDGYGIHGTIDPSSIGRQMSMGCIRLYDDDIRMLFGMLAPEKSTVIIRD